MNNPDQQIVRPETAKCFDELLGCCDEVTIKKSYSRKNGMNFYKAVADGIEVEFWSVTPCRAIHELHEKMFKKSKRACCSCNCF